MKDEVIFRLDNNQLLGTEQVFEDGKTYRQTWPDGSGIRVLMVKHGRLELERLPDGRFAYAPKNIMGREIKRIETQWIPVGSDDKERLAPTPETLRSAETF